MSKELEWYIDGKIQLPKSVYITIDDGARTKIAVDLLKEYKYYATIFLVTSTRYLRVYYTNEYIELHSHTDNMHNQVIVQLDREEEFNALIKIKY